MKSYFWRRVSKDLHVTVVTISTSNLRHQWAESAFRRGFALDMASYTTATVIVMHKHLEHITFIPSAEAIHSLSVSSQNVPPCTPATLT